jgi:hypothetical protein
MKGSSKWQCSQVAKRLWPGKSTKESPCTFELLTINNTNLIVLQTSEVKQQHLVTAEICI